jgi:hypothetical protein
MPARQPSTKMQGERYNDDDDDDDDDNNDNSHAGGDSRRRFDNRVYRQPDRSG